MNIVHKNNAYGSNVEHVFDKQYDYCLFRQDWNGSESVYFNSDEIQEVVNKIFEGEILVHHNYSILYCKNQSLMDSYPKDYIFCYMTIYNDLDND